MLPTVFRTALRNLRRNRGFAGLNVAGLAIGFAVVIVIALYVRDERLVDRFHENADRIVRVDAAFEEEGGVGEPGAYTQGRLAPALEAEVPAVEATVRLVETDPVLRTKQTAVETGGLLLADPEVFDVFTFPFVAGSPATALDRPGSVVLTESLAASLFGRADALGQTVYAGDDPLTVTGVMADVPRRSHLQFDGLISLSTVPDPGWWYENWFSVAFSTYVLLEEGVSPAAFDARLDGFAQAAAGDAMRDVGRTFTLHARPLADLYLTTSGGIGTYGNGAALRVLTFVALFVLVVAAINFTNLATARSLDRAREVGVRKSLGALRGGLAAQFLAEAVVLAVVSLGAAVVLAALALPALEALTGKPLSLLDLGPWWLGVAGLTVVTGLLAGAYPAFVLSGFRPAEVLKGRFATGRRGATLRRGLVVVQFGISVALIAATVVVFAQLQYVEGRDLGLDLGGEATELVTVPFAGDSTVVSRLGVIQDRLSDLPGVVGVTASVAAPTTGGPGATGAVDGPDGVSREATVDFVIADADYADVYGLTVLAGRAPREPAAEDGPREYVLNETAVRAVGYAEPEGALGQSAGFWGMPGTVVGVVRDYHIRGLQQAVDPLAITTASGGIATFQNVLTLRVRRDGLPATLVAVGGVWADLAPTRPFTYSFLDEDFAAEYAAEREFGRLFAVFAALAIAIAVLGLFGLAAHAAQLRRKEIGVRRVLGASVADVVVRLTRGTVGLVAVGVALAAPAVVWGMSRWLDGFAYRTDVGWEPLAVAGLAVLAVAVATVGGLSARAAAADPVHALRAD